MSVFIYIFSVIFLVGLFVWHTLRFLWQMEIDDKEYGDVLAIHLAIKDGAKAFLKKEYTTIAIVLVIMAICILTIIGIGDNWKDGAFSMVGFCVGAGCSMLAGFLSMAISVYSNARTTIQVYCCFYKHTPQLCFFLCIFTVADNDKTQIQTFYFIFVFCFVFFLFYETV